MSKKYSFIKIYSMVLILGIFFLVPVFAQNDMSSVESAAKLIDCVTNFLSWSWVIFAVLAWKMMSNDFVYGSVFNLDTYLWQIWNIMKNFANFTIGFMFLFYILKHLFDKDESFGQLVKKKIVSFLVAGILVQSSWFILWALLDITTIATSAVGSFPAQIIQKNDNTIQKNDNTIQKTLTAHLIEIKKTKVSFTEPKSGSCRFVSVDKDSNKKVDENKDLDKFLDSILPSESSLSGPLMFIGASILKYFNFASEHKLNQWASVTFLISTLINFGSISVFSLALILLFIINTVRVVLLWIIICFSPFLFLFAILKKMWWIDLGAKMPEWLQLEKVVMIVFKPVIYTVYLSLMLIILISMNQILSHIGTSNPDKVMLHGFEIEDSATRTSIQTENLGGIIVNGLQDGFAGILISLFTIFLLWQLIKIAMDGMPFLKWFTDGVVSLIKSSATSLPILPWPKWATSWTALKTSKKDLLSKTERELWVNLRRSNMWSFNTKWNAALQSKINKAIWLKDWAIDFSDTDINNINDIIKNMKTSSKDNTDNVFKQIAKTIKNSKWTATFNNNTHLMNWVWNLLKDGKMVIKGNWATTTITPNPNFTGNTDEEKKKELKAYLNNNNNWSLARKYICKMLWNPNAWNDTSWILYVKFPGG